MNFLEIVMNINSESHESGKEKNCLQNHEAGSQLFLFYQNFIICLFSLLLSKEQFKQTVL